VKVSAHPSLQILPRPSWPLAEADLGLSILVDLLPILVDLLPTVPLDPDKSNTPERHHLTPGRARSCSACLGTLGIYKEEYGDTQQLWHLHIWKPV